MMATRYAQLNKCLDSCQCYVCRAHRGLTPRHATEFVERVMRDLRREKREAEYQARLARQRSGWFVRLFGRRA
jgi:hypothetical protein